MIKFMVQTGALLVLAGFLAACWFGVIRMTCRITFGG